MRRLSSSSSSLTSPPITRHCKWESVGEGRTWFSSSNTLGQLSLRWRMSSGGRRLPAAKFPKALSRCCSDCVLNDAPSRKLRSLYRIWLAVCLIAHSLSRSLARSLGRSVECLHVPTSPPREANKHLRKPFRGKPGRLTDRPTDGRTDRLGDRPLGARSSGGQRSEKSQSRHSGKSNV